MDGMILICLPQELWGHKKKRVRKTGILICFSVGKMRVGETGEVEMGGGEMGVNLVYPFTYI